MMKSKLLSELWLEISSTALVGLKIEVMTTANLLVVLIAEEGLLGLKGC
jgi:hypothetical protein